MIEKCLFSKNEVFWRKNCFEFFSFQIISSIQRVENLNLSWRSHAPIQRIIFEKIIEFWKTSQTPRDDFFHLWSGEKGGSVFFISNYFHQFKSNLHSQCVLKNDLKNLISINDFSPPQNEFIFWKAKGKSLAPFRGFRTQTFVWKTRVLPILPWGFDISNLRSFGASIDSHTSRHQLWKNVSY